MHLFMKHASLPACIEGVLLDAAEYSLLSAKPRSCVSTSCDNCYDVSHARFEILCCLYCLCSVRLQQS